MGVSLGDFDDENEFCTIQFTLNEGKQTKISTLDRIKVALEWTIKTYLKLMLVLFFLSLSAYLLVKVLEKIKASDFTSNGN